MFQLLKTACVQPHGQIFICHHIKKAACHTCRWEPYSKNQSKATKSTYGFFLFFK